MKDTVPTRCVWPLRAILGEGPIWSARDNAIYFVDIKKPALHRYNLADSQCSTWAMPEPLGWVIEREAKPGFIAGFRSGFATLTLDPLHIEIFARPEADRPTNRLNDAKADAQGRIWAGSMDDNEACCSGALYGIFPDLSWRRVDDGYRICNGPTFNPAGDILYHADSALRIVYAYNLDVGGALTKKRVFIRFEEAWGYPDGMATDADGGIWIAHWEGGRVSRFTPDGVLDRSIHLPASRLTSCTFGGADLDRLFVTSAAIGCDGEEYAGALFKISPGVRGMPTYMFGG